MLRKRSISSFAADGGKSMVKPKLRVTLFNILICLMVLSIIILGYFVAITFENQRSILKSQQKFYMSISTPEKQIKPKIVVEPAIYKVPNMANKEEVEPRYGFTDDDIYILAQLLCGDESINGDGEYDFVYWALQGDMNYEEMSKVLCVIMNRTRTQYFPDTVYDVLYAPGQFADFTRSDTKPAPLALEKIREWCKAYDQWDLRVQTIPEDHVYFVSGPNLTNVTSNDWR